MFLGTKLRHSVEEYKSVLFNHANEMEYQNVFMSPQELLKFMKLVAQFTCTLDLIMMVSKTQ